MSKLIRRASKASGEQPINDLFAKLQNKKREGRMQSRNIGGINAHNSNDSIQLVDEQEGKSVKISSIINNQMRTNSISALRAEVKISEI